MKSLSLFVGTGNCNANCRHCAGKPLRVYAPKNDGEVDEQLILKTAQECYNNGAKYLSLSCSGEPTLSPVSLTKTLKILKEANLNFSPINLYSNGIVFYDLEYCKKYLPQWKSLGLTTIYITVHSVDEKINASIYNIKEYPNIKTIIQNIKDYDLNIRANMILGKNIVSSFDMFKFNVIKLFEYGVNKISVWTLRTLDDKLDIENGLSPEEIKQIKDWIYNSGFKVSLLLEDSKKRYEVGDKLTLFPNGILSNRWCN